MAANNAAVSGILRTTGRRWPDAGGPVGASRETRRIAATRIRFPAWLLARRIRCRLFAIHALHGEVTVKKKVAFIPAASALGSWGASRGDRQLRLASGRANAALQLSTETPTFCRRRHSTVLIPWTPRKPHVQESLPRARPPGIMPSAGVQHASRRGPVPHARREITPYTYWMLST